jgi:hypothetical protein
MFQRDPPQFPKLVERCHDHRHVVRRVNVVTQTYTGRPASKRRNP